MGNVFPTSETVKSTAGVEDYLIERLQAQGVRDINSRYTPMVRDRDDLWYDCWHGIGYIDTGCFFEVSVASVGMLFVYICRENNREHGTLSNFFINFL